ncbi:hypothetical protein M3Y97_01120700 [Aphelenchoides bicaudatus]|nr:hypothetical protein M3Y97_01120700 [Aphelenchoides bicaudatus]
MLSVKSIVVLLICAAITANAFQIDQVQILTNSAPPFQHCTDFQFGLIAQSHEEVGVTEEGYKPFTFGDEPELTRLTGAAMNASNVCLDFVEKIYADEEKFKKFGGKFVESLKLGRKDISVVKTMFYGKQKFEVLIRACSY